MPPTTLEITIQRCAGAEAPVVAVLRAPASLPVQRTRRLQLNDDDLLQLTTPLLDPLTYGTFLVCAPVQLRNPFLIHTTTLVRRRNIGTILTGRLQGRNDDSHQTPVCQRNDFGWGGPSGSKRRAHPRPHSPRSAA